MMQDNKQQNQSRFLLASLLSLVVITAYGYFFTPKKPTNENTNATLTDRKPKSALVNRKTPETKETKLMPISDDVENRTLTIKTPLYEVKLDSKGGIAKSWVLLLNDAPEGEEKQFLYAHGSTKTEKNKLELIPSEPLKRKPQETPFLLHTSDEQLDDFVNQRNYHISVSEDNIELSGSESKKIDFTLKNKEAGIEVVKSFVFYADSYVTDLSLKFEKDGQTVQNVKLLIGASIGDQGIEKYDFYKVEPEGIAYMNGDVNRQYAASIANKDKGQQAVAGKIEWAGIGDTYFAMVAVPSRRLSGLEYRSTKYEVETEPFYDGIIAWIIRSQSTRATKHLITAYVPITSDGEVNHIYTGTKDIFVLNKYGKKLTESSNRNIDIDEIVNYGWLRFFTKPLSYPILLSLNYLTRFTYNYGISIIIFTFFLYSLLFPLRWYSSKSFKKLQKNAPKMKALQDKTKALQKKGVPLDDPEMRKLQMEQLKMTKDVLPIGGCLPVLLQFPFLIAVYYAASIALGFRQATFLWLPDLSSADPYKILPIAFAVSMVLIFKFSPTTPAITPEQKMQQKIMTYILPVMMLWIMWTAPSGLLLYWFAGNIIMFGQQIFINRINSGEDEIEKDEDGKDPKLAAL